MANATQLAKGIAKGIVKASAAGADRLRRPPQGVVVLLYHRVGGASGLEIDLPVARFEEQMALLAERSRPVALADALDVLRAAAPPPPPAPVVVTFDDGTADFVELALPVLERYRVPATLYLATGFVESAGSFPSGGVPLSWSALAEARSTGLVTVGSHTHSHALLDRLPPGEVDAELDRSVALIEDRLGVTPHDFAYPKALLGSPPARDAVARRFRSAAVAGTRPNAYGRTDPRRLARSPIQTSDGMRWFLAKLAGGMALEDDLRRMLNRRRYAGAVT